MKEFFLGLLVLLALIVLGALGVLLSPLFVVMGFFLQCLLALALFIFAVWLLGKVALWGIQKIRK